MKTVLTCIIIAFYLFTDVHAQKEDYMWFLGGPPIPTGGSDGMVIDWNDSPVPEHSLNGLGINGNNASICDAEGNLLFWSNGCAVMNRNQGVMPNGDTLNWDLFREVIGWASCLRGYPGVQNMKILPDPADEDGFYIIHKAWKYNGQFEDVTFELRHSYVDMRLDGGLGDVVYFDSVLYEGRTTLSNLEAVHAQNGSDWWVLQPIENDSFLLIYRISENGIERFPDQNASVFFPFERSGGGTMRISPDGTKLAYYDYFLNLHVYDFDRATGQISNHQKVTIFDDAEEMPNNKYRFGSVEWSPNSRFMYVAVRDSLFQVDGWEADMGDGILLIDVYNGTLDPFTNTFYVATLAPDCKIYICSTSGNLTYHVIHRPDELGTACDFVQNGLLLPQYPGSANLPLFPRFRVDEAEKCDPTITSVFGDAVFYRRDLNIFPNPTSGPVAVEIPSGWEGGLLVIFDTNGQMVKQLDLPHSTKQLEMNLSNLIAGVYHIELYPAHNKQQIFYGGRIVVAK